MTADSRNWFVLALFALAAWLTWRLAPVITPFAISAGLAYLGDPMVDRLEKLRFFRWPFSRTVAVLVVFVMMTGAFALVLLILIPLLVEQVRHLVERVPEIFEWLVDTGVPAVQTWLGLESMALNTENLIETAKDYWREAGTALLGILLGYAVVKGRGSRLSKIVEQIAFLPYVIPGIVFGAVYIAMFTKPLGPIPALYGTFTLLVVVSIADHLPYSSRSGVSAMMQVGRELEEAAQIAGASVWRRFRRIIFPLTSAGFVSGFLLTFITTMRSLSLIILLVTPETQVLSSQTMFYIENGDTQMANVVVLILIGLIALGNLIIGRFRGGSLKKGLGM